ncbi:MAG: hypothetical protein JNK89_11665, partial [Saprospiraceae bacterium]|nr:hypothetical protein [Saprospiraceae bacterium]
MPKYMPFYAYWSVSLLLLLTSTSLISQPATIKWFPEVKTAKDQRTLLLLDAGPEGFQLLRWQDRRTDAAGNRSPAQPLLTLLTPNGERQHDEPLPGFETGALDFRFALASRGELLVVFEAQNSAGTRSLFARRLDLKSRTWLAEPQALFTDTGGRAPAFANAWFSRSADGRHSCIYQIQSGARPKAALAVVDEQLNLLWQRTTEFPPTSGQMVLRQVVCLNSGSVLVHGQIFNPGEKMQGQPYESTPATFASDGRPLFRPAEWAATAVPYSDAVFLSGPDIEGLLDFYPRFGKKYTPSFEVSEGPDGKIYCSGLYSNLDNEQVEGYFVYAIDPAKRQAEVLQNAPLPTSVRKAYLSDKAVEKKEPVKGLALRWLRWTADGRPWLLAERQNFDLSQSRMEAAVLLRLDSTYRINNARKVEKYQRLPAGDPQNFASLAACPAPKTGWWLLWNLGNWPNGKIMLTE